MDEQTDRRFQLQKSIARQKARRDSISQELELYRQEIQGPPEKKKSEKKEDLHKQIVDTRVLIEDARQRIAYNLDRLSEDFRIEVNLKDYIVEAPLKSLLVGLAVGFYFGLRK